MSAARGPASAWIYQGVWAALVRFFRVPAEPPALPLGDGDHVRTLRPSPGFLRYLKCAFWVALLPADIVPIAGWVAMFVALPSLALVLSPLFLVLIVLPDLVAYVGIHLRYDTTWYVLTNRSLRIRRGVWVIHETTISFDNVQNVEVRQGPLQRYFGIADVIVQTAGGGSGQKHGKGGGPPGAHVALLQGLDDADAVRDGILRRVRSARTAGLGDDVLELGRISRSTTVSPAHLAALREIRTVAVRLAGGA